MHSPTPSAARIRELADSLGFLTEEDLQALTEWSPTTISEHRKRHTGPAWVRCGSRYLYPRKLVAQWLNDRVRESAQQLAKELL